MLVDTHCHLDFHAFDADRPQVIDRARAAGVERIVNPATDVASSAAAVRLAEETPEVYAAVGIHPNDALTFDKSSIQDLRRLAQHPKVKAIGEIGLDYYRQHAPHDVQMVAFRAQLALAAELGLPVIIHNRDANEDMLAVLAAWREALVKSGSPLVDRPGVMHSFAGSEQTARAALELGMFIGFTGPVTFKNAPELQKVAGGVPVERILVETDAPFLAPHPNRGRRNEPAFVRITAEKIAALHQTTLDIIARQTTENARRLFNW